MTTRWILTGIAASFLLLGLQTASATPPAGSTCVEGYNPDALANVCYSNTNPTTVNVPTLVSETPGPPVCLIGDICAPNPQFQLLPGGSTPHTVPGGPVPDYVEVLGSPVPMGTAPVTGAVQCYRYVAQSVVAGNPDVDSAGGASVCAVYRLTGINLG